MNESTPSTPPVSVQQQVEADLLHAVLSSDVSYPWDAYSPDTAAYLDQLEHSIDPALLDDETLSSQWSTMSAIATALWADTDSPLSATLMQKFGARMPQSLLAQLAERAQSAANSGQTLIDQLVMSAQAVLSGWEADDLQVMARPLAMAMRSGDADPIDRALQTTRAVAWEDLTAMEQAKLSLAIARYALAELDADA